MATHTGRKPRPQYTSIRYTPPDRTHSRDLRRSLLDLALLGAPVVEAGQDMLGVQLVERSDLALDTVQDVLDLIADIDPAG